MLSLQLAEVKDRAKPHRARSGALLSRLSWAVLTPRQSGVLRARPRPAPPCLLYIWFFFLPLSFFLMTKSALKNNRPPVSPQSARHSEGELTWFRSPGFQTANKTAVTRAPLVGSNAFQTHRKEAVRVSRWLEWGGMVSAACSPHVSQGQRLPHGGLFLDCIMCVCVLVSAMESKCNMKLKAFKKGKRERLNFYLLKTTTISCLWAAVGLNRQSCSCSIEGHTSALLNHSSIFSTNYGEARNAESGGIPKLARLWSLFNPPPPPGKLMLRSHQLASVRRGSLTQRCTVPISLELSNLKKQTKAHKNTCRYWLFFPSPINDIKWHLPRRKIYSSNCSVSL